VRIIDDRAWICWTLLEPGAEREGLITEDAEIRAQRTRRKIKIDKHEEAG